MLPLCAVITREQGCVQPAHAVPSASPGVRSTPADLRLCLLLRGRLNALRRKRLNPCASLPQSAGDLAGDGLRLIAPALRNSQRHPASPAPSSAPSARAEPGTGPDTARTDSAAWSIVFIPQSQRGGRSPNPSASRLGRQPCGRRQPPLAPGCPD